MGRPETRGGDPAVAFSTKACKSEVRRYGIEDTISSVSFETSLWTAASIVRPLG